jgi:hypothetical protein
MRKVHDVPLEEMLDDLSAMLGDDESYEFTMKMMKLNEDEELLFKRARLHLNKGNPDKLIIKKAYEILIAKSFQNQRVNTLHSDNAIYAGREEHVGVVQLVVQTIKNNLQYIVIAFVIALILKNILL